MKLQLIIFSLAYLAQMTSFSCFALKKENRNLNLNNFRLIKGPKLKTNWGQELEVNVWPQFNKNNALILHFAVFENNSPITNRGLFAPENRGLKNVFPYPNNNINNWNEYYTFEKDQILARSYEVLEPEKGALVVTWRLKKGKQEQTFSMVIRTIDLTPKISAYKKELKYKIKEDNVKQLKERLVRKNGLKSPKIWNKPHIILVPSNYEQVRKVSYKTLLNLTGKNLVDKYHFRKGEKIYVTDEAMKIYDLEFIH